MKRAVSTCQTAWLVGVKPWVSTATDSRCYAAVKAVLGLGQARGASGQDAEQQLSSAGVSLLFAGSRGSLASEQGHSD